MLKYRVPKPLDQIYRKSLHPIGNLRRGENIYSREWDLCIVIDACRLDLFEEVADDYNSVTSVGEMISVDSKTDAWIRKTFAEVGPAVPEKTAYISANPFSMEVPDEDSFAIFDRIWRYEWDEEIGTVHPRVVTDRAISVGRQNDVDRLLLHYLQPHVPFIKWQNRSTMGRGNFGLDGYYGNDEWEKLRDREVSESEIWDAYRENLNLVLPEVELLLENIDADCAVITSDHGNALGEWGIFGHPIHMPFHCLRAVPWAPVSAVDEETYIPAEYDTTSGAGVPIKEQLQALGYK